LKRVLHLLLLVLVFTLSQCAKKGRPSGGPKDEDPPIFVTANPPYGTINFDKDEIRLFFNEYIKLKDLNKQLIVSPPLNPENPSVITPQGSPSEYINIKLIDTLKENTTYIFNFGNSVEDNNEGNTLEGFKYVFSTGSYIDSLTLKGGVKNSYSSENIKDIKMLLYRLDSSYTDSAVYNIKPSYVASTLDTSRFEFTNMKEGKYLLMALKDQSSDYQFDPRSDEIGFYRDTIVLPRDTIIDGEISLFREILPYAFRRGKEERKGKLIFGYEGEANDIDIQLVSDVPNDFRSIILPEKGKDTLNYWHSPIENDSLVFYISKGQFLDTAVVRLRKKKFDSLSVTTTIRSTLEFADTLFFDTNNPIVKIDTSKVTFVDKDTVNVPYEHFISKTESKIGFLFEKKYKEQYDFTMLPEAVEDIFNQKNDTIQLKFRTKALEDYGDIKLSIDNPSSRNVIIQIINNRDETIKEKSVNSTTNISFDYLKPESYKVRIIYDDNNNGKWDTGDFLNKRQPELVEYFEEIQPVRPNWSLNAVITIKP
jgi:uncharacterized protein (DUF2141 family)